VCRFFLDNQTSKRGGRHRPHLNVIFDLGSFEGHLDGGTSLPRSVLERYCCDGHHIHWFSRGGATRLDNLVLLCRRHHRRLHQPGWHAKLLPDATFEVTNPQGVVRTSHPPGALQPFW